MIKKLIMSIPGLSDEAYKLFCNSLFPSGGTKAMNSILKEAKPQEAQPQEAQPQEATIKDDTSKTNAPKQSRKERRYNQRVHDKVQAKLTSSKPSKEFKSTQHKLNEIKLKVKEEQRISQFTEADQERLAKIILGHT